MKYLRHHLKLLDICVPCVMRERPCHGPCACNFDPAKPVQVFDRVRAEVCPAGFFPARTLRGRALHCIEQLVSAGRPGYRAKRVLERSGFVPIDGGLRCPGGKVLSMCGCNIMAARMDLLGYGGCVAHLPELLRWFSDKAKECGVVIDRVAWRIFWSAVWTLAS